MFSNVELKGKCRGVKQKNCSGVFLDSGHYKEFIVPELPRGKHLTLDILSTWGDKHFVGLSGIEIFSASGESAIVSEVSFYNFHNFVLKNDFFLSISRNTRLHQ